MIYYWLHLIYIFVGSRLFWKKVNLDANLKRTRIVSILDCESFRYMANSKYFYYMDLIRYEIMFRSSLYENTVKKGMFGVIGSQKVIYKKPLKRWTKFDITLILEGWDEKWIYHRQIFKQNNKIYAIGFTKITFWKNKKAQNINEIMANCGLTKNKLTSFSEILKSFENDYDIIKNAKS
ncbi:thioesterase family protein [Yeosuana sp. MJ-SS3]|uniref:Thioesterase family protein n=1 Tax=Gilvirhabdus luticola TaxID=3079858 RepID=A0ABU3U6L3_9FLAO|nr:thioesterase family protein [Yeosuana sp. MJ-SS3]MDU8886048.1 thioesterase family protein [Yeosuana sp. MJ-SS3]